MSENRQRAVIPDGYRLRPPPDEPIDEPGPAQFGIGSLLLLQLGFAVFLFLLMTTGAFAVFVAFLATVLLQWGHYRLPNVALRRIVYERWGLDIHNWLDRQNLPPGFSVSRMFA